MAIEALKNTTGGSFKRRNPEPEFHPVREGKRAREI